MSDFTTIEICYDDFDLPPLELPPPKEKEMINFSDIIHTLLNKNRLGIKPYTIQDILQGNHLKDRIINID